MRRVCQQWWRFASSETVWSLSTKNRTATEGSLKRQLSETAVRWKFTQSTAAASCLTKRTGNSRDLFSAARRDLLRRFTATSSAVQQEPSQKKNSDNVKDPVEKSDQSIAETESTVPMESSASTDQVNQQTPCFEKIRLWQSLR